MIYRTALLSILILPNIGALMGFIIGKKSEKIRDAFNIFITGITLLIATLLFKRVMLEPIKLFIPDIMGIGLSLKLDAFRYIFVWVTIFVWFLCTIYSTQYLIRYKNRNRYYSFFMLTLGSTVGIFLSQNMLNLFTFFEIMSFTSYILIIHDQDQYSLDAGRSYLGMAIGAGLVLLMGLFLLFDYTGTLDIEKLPNAIKYIGNIKYLISALIITGFAAKASMFPLHVWLPKAHPAAPTPSSAILSGILIKTGIFGIIITIHMVMGSDYILSSAILVFGFINMFFGGMMALMQRNIKRILAYSSMSQAGYILVGIGLIGLLKEHKAIAIYATLYHIFNHAIFKVLLFMGAGIIYMILHELSINKICGFGKHKTRLKIVFFIGLLAIIGMPGFNGFVSKTLLHEALSEAAHMYHNIWFVIAEIIFTLSSSFTVAYLLKIFISVFMEENEKYKGQYKEHIKKRALFPMTILGIAVIYIGIYPNALMELISNASKTFGIYEVISLHVYSLESIKTSIMTIVLGIVIYIGFVRKYLLKIVDGKKLYINPSLTWLNIERDIYWPVMRITFGFSSTIFNWIDRAAVNSVHFIGKGIRSLSGMQIKLNKGNKIDLKNVVDTRSLSNIMVKMYGNMSSLMYAVFIFAAVFAVILVVVVVFHMSQI